MKTAEENTEIAYWAGRLIGYDQAWEVAEEIVEVIKQERKAYAEQAIDKFAKRLEQNGYIDSDYWSEGMIDEFKQELK